MQFNAEETLTKIDNAGKRFFARLIGLVMSIGVIIIILILAVFAVFGYHLWNFGTVKLGPYYVNAWQGNTTDEPYFHFGKSDRESAQKQFIAESPVPTRVVSNINTGLILIPTPNTKSSKSSEKYPQIKLKTPEGWVINKDSSGREIQLKNRDNKYCVAGADNNRECETAPTDQEVVKDLDGITNGVMLWYNFCEHFESAFESINQDCEKFDLTKFQAYKDVLLPSFTWPETPECLPTLMANKSIAELTSVGKYNGLKQKANILCLYEALGSGSLPTMWSYYIPVKNESKYNLLYIQFNYIESSPEAKEAKTKFDEMLKTLEVVEL